MEIATPRQVGARNDKVSGGKQSWSPLLKKGRGQLHAAPYFKSLSVLSLPNEIPIITDPGKSAYIKIILPVHQQPSENTMPLLNYCVLYPHGTNSAPVMLQLKGVNI
jgi:hypothetical protein